MQKADFDTYIARFNEEDPGAFEMYMAPDVRMLNGTLELNGIAEVKAHLRADLGRDARGTLRRAVRQR